MNSNPLLQTNLLLKLPTDYVRNENPHYYQDGQNLHDDVWQPEVHMFVEHLLERTNYECVIDVGSGNGAKLADLKFSGKKIGIDFGDNLDAARMRFPDIDWREADLNNGLDLSGLPKNCLVICSDVLEHLSSPHVLIQSFKSMMDEGVATTVVASTPDRDRARGVGSNGPPANPAHVQEWSFVEFAALLSSFGVPANLHGHTRNFSKSETRNTQIAVSESRLFKPEFGPHPEILAVVPVFNEIDIIRETIQKLRIQQLNVHVIDNWSDDGSYELIMSMAEVDSRITVERFPQSPSKNYLWEQILQLIEHVGYQSKCDWILHVDADESIESFSSLIGLREAIGVADRLGYDSIDFTGIDLRPTELTSFGGLAHHWEFIRRPGGRHLHRGWKNDGRRSQISDSGGHLNRAQTKLFPYNFLLMHYPLRSESQAVKKIFSDRFPRIGHEKSSRGWHTQYDSFDRGSSFVWDSRRLNPLSWDLQREYLPEILGRCGVYRDIFYL